MIRLGSLAGYPFEGPRTLAGWIPPHSAAVYAIMTRLDPEKTPTICGYLCRTCSRYVK